MSDTTGPDAKRDAILASKARRRERQKYPPAPIPEPPAVGVFDNDENEDDEEGTESVARSYAKSPEVERAEADAMRKAYQASKPHVGMRARLVQAANAPDFGALPRETIGDMLVYELVRRALGRKDEKALIYVMDQIIGKPKARVVSKSTQRRTHELVLPPQSEAPIPKALAASLAINSKVKIVRKSEAVTAVDGEIVDGGDVPELDIAASPDDDQAGGEG